MRTKTLLLTAALSAAGVAASMAQVYSVNVVGYVNVTVPANSFAILANPLNNGANNLADVLKLPDGFDGVTIFRYNPTTQAFYDSATWMFGQWLSSATESTAPLAPGEGFFIQNTAANPLTITFVGEVLQGSLSTPIPAGFSIKGSQVPTTGKLGAAGVANTLGFPAADGDTVYIFDSATGAYKDSYTFFNMLGGWNSSSDPDVNGPSIPVGTGFWIQKAGAASAWTRTFTVN